MNYYSYDLPSAVTEEGLASMVCASVNESVKEYLSGVTDYVARCQQRVAELEEALGIVTAEKHALVPVIQRPATPGGRAQGVPCHALAGDELQQQGGHRGGPCRPSNPSIPSIMNTLNFTFNFNAPVGQNIAHVDHLEAHFDKDMTM